MTVRRINLYIDEETDELLDELAEAGRAEHGVHSRSAVVRRAVRELGDRELASRQQTTALQRRPGDAP